ncbi:hypothetical protein [Methylobacterium sp.]|uniref:hypothetical protein n=1 Tax=Methylobacterium sp. TaxID=409 RepID=UPI0025FD2C52|nr:hypothetical protein [Methylobacterium sp.]MBY0257454.1 hypothetical protein [Methylobacterium sp.]
MANKIEDFTLDMIEKARENEVALSALGPAQQVKFINSKIRHNDAVFAIVPSDDAPHQGALYVITGAPVLDGSGFDLKVVETDGSSKNEKPVVLQRTLRLTAFFVASYMDARFLDIAFGDSAASDITGGNSRMMVGNKLSKTCGRQQLLMDERTLPRIRSMFVP